MQPSFLILFCDAVHDLPFIDCFSVSQAFCCQLPSGRLMVGSTQRFHQPAFLYLFYLFFVFTQFCKSQGGHGKHPHNICRQYHTGKSHDPYCTPVRQSIELSSESDAPTRRISCHFSSVNASDTRMNKTPRTYSTWVRFTTKSTSPQSLRHGKQQYAGDRDVASDQKE